MTMIQWVPAEATDIMFGGQTDWTEIVAESLIVGSEFFECVEISTDRKIVGRVDELRAVRYGRSVDFVARIM